MTSTATNATIITDELYRELTGREPKPFTLKTLEEVRADNILDRVRTDYAANVAMAQSLRSAMWRGETLQHEIRLARQAKDWRRTADAIKAFVDHCATL